MPDQSVIDLIAQSLANGLTHPGDQKSGPIALPLPMFRTASLPPDMAEQFAQEAGLPHADIARLTAEALVHTMENSGKAIVDTAELERLQAVDAAAEPHRHRDVHFHCHCGGPIARANVTGLDTDKPKLHAGRFIEAVKQVHPNCAPYPDGHQVPS